MFGSTEIVFVKTFFTFTSVGTMENVSQPKIIFWLTIKHKHLRQILVYTFIFCKPFPPHPNLINWTIFQLCLVTSFSHTYRNIMHLLNRNVIVGMDGRCLIFVNLAMHTLSCKKYIIYCACCSQCLLIKI